MATKMKTKKFKVEVTVKVDLDELPEGVEVGKDTIVSLVEEAISDYCDSLGDAVSASGDAEEAHHWVASNHPEVKVK